MKFCKKCQVETERYVSGGCKPCTVARDAAYRVTNREKVAVVKAANVDRIMAYALRYAAAVSTTWHTTNPSMAAATCATWRAANPSKAAASVAAWRKANPDKTAAYTASRKASKLQRTPKWLSLKQLALIEEMYLNAKLMSAFDGQIYHVDHIVPLQGKTVSGLHVPWNSQLLTASENASKHNRTWPDMP